MTEQPLPIVYPTQPNPPPRPRLSDAKVGRAAAETMADAVMSWLEDECGDREEVIEQLTNAMSGTFYNDGYEIATFLDRHHGWSPDAELVGILDGPYAYDAERIAIRAWVEANGIRPLYAVGDTVSWRQQTGIIVAIRFDAAEYVIQTEKWVSENPKRAGNPGGYLVAFELCTKGEPT